MDFNMRIHIQVRTPGGVLGRKRSTITWALLAIGGLRMSTIVLFLVHAATHTTGYRLEPYRRTREQRRGFCFPGRQSRDPHERRNGDGFCMYCTAVHFLFIHLFREHEDVGKGVAVHQHAQEKHGAEKLAERCRLRSAALLSPHTHSRLCKHGAHVGDAVDLGTCTHNAAAVFFSVCSFFIAPGYLLCTCQREDTCVSKRSLFRKSCRYTENLHVADRLGQERGQEGQLLSNVPARFFSRAPLLA